MNMNMEVKVSKFFVMFLFLLGIFIGGILGIILCEDKHKHKIETKPDVEKNFCTEEYTIKPKNNFYIM